MILDEKEAANRKFARDNSSKGKNHRNNGNRQDRKPKNEGLNLSGLAKFMR